MDLLILDNLKEAQHHSMMAEYDGIEEDENLITIDAYLLKKLEAQDIEMNIERGENTEGWGLLPDICLEKIFSHLSIRDRYNASLVCLQWNRGFYMQKTWENFEFGDSTLTRNKYNYHSGWQEVLDHLKAQMFLYRVGKFIRRLVIKPMSNLFNLYEFVNMMSFYAEKYQEGKSPCMTKIKSFRFTFWCSKDKDRNKDEVIYGTGGKLLEAVKRLMNSMTDLEELELIDLLLDLNEAATLLDDVCFSLTQRLRKLTLINSTKIHFSLLHPATFVNLQVLKITPQNISDEVIEFLCLNLRFLKELHLIQTPFTKPMIKVSPKSWTMVKTRFNVYLRTVGNTDQEIFWQEKCPVSSIIYDCPKTKISWDSIITVIDLYKTTLKEYGHFGLPRFWRSNKFDERADGPIVSLCRKCSFLTKLYIRERISSSTVLLIAGISSNLKYFCIRSNGILLRNDLENHNLIDLDKSFIQWVKENCKSYELMRVEVSKILDYEWKPLSDKEFKEICSCKPAY